MQPICEMHHICLTEYSHLGPITLDEPGRGGVHLIISYFDSSQN